MAGQRVQQLNLVGFSAVTGVPEEEVEFHRAGAAAAG
jgi:hypothetical protein